MPRRKPDPRLLSAFLLLAALPLAPVGAQDAFVPLTLEQSIDAALSQGTDSVILLKNLAVSREQYNLAVSQSAYSLAASLGENGTYGYGDATLLTLNSLSSGFGQTPQAGITLATPTTTVGFSTSPYVAASPLATEIAASTGASPGPSGTSG